jgi:hypothetical protein
VTEVAIFLTLLNGLMVTAARRADSQEYLSVSTYDTVLVVDLSYWSASYPRPSLRRYCTSGGGCGTHYTTTEHRRRGQRCGADEADPRPGKLAAWRAVAGFRLFQLGIASTAEMQVLIDYTDKVESLLVNTTTHVFISYRYLGDG